MKCTATIKTPVKSAKLERTNSNHQFDYDDFEYVWRNGVKVPVLEEFWLGGCNYAKGIVFYGDGYYFEHPLEILATNHGGMSFHGGLVGGILGGVIACRVCKLSAWTIADLAVIGVPLALCLGRCANFVNGELWGKPTDLPWGVVFESGGDVARHPSQLYEALLEGILLFIMMQLLSRKKPLLPQGTFMGVFVAWYGIARILVEFVRVPDAQLGYILGGVITMGQLLSLPLVLIGVALIVYALRAKRPQRAYLA